MTAVALLHLLSAPAADGSDPAPDQQSAVFRTAAVLVPMAVLHSAAVSLAVAVEAAGGLISIFEGESPAATPGATLCRKIVLAASDFAAAASVLQGQAWAGVSVSSSDKIFAERKHTHIMKKSRW